MMMSPFLTQFLFNCKISRLSIFSKICFVEARKKNDFIKKSGSLLESGSLLDFRYWNVNDLGLASRIIFIMNPTENRDPWTDYLVRESRLIEIVLKNDALELNETILLKIKIMFKGVKG